ncbi:MAG: chromate transporter [bacterium]|nr:chromate transporter [bacterium]
MNQLAYQQDAIDEKMGDVILIPFEETKGKSQKRLIRAILSNLKIGFIGFGGGSILIPVIEKEVVEEQGLISEEQLNKDIVVASITPGALPVEIASAVGRRVGGIKGMVLAAMAMALPGAFLMVMLLSVITASSDGILEQIQYIAMGINCFITFLLTEYVVGAIKVCKKEKRLEAGIIIMLLVVFATCGKEIYGLLGIERTPIFDVSTLSVLSVTFFVIFFTQGKREGHRVFIAGVISTLYLLCVGKAGIISGQAVKNTLVAVMVLLSIYGIVCSLREKKIEVNCPYSKMIKETISCIAVIFLCSLPAIVMVENIVMYIGKGLISTMLSFGGGDAYLTIAESMFVNDTMVSSEQFYSQLVPIANALPGSILCKMLSGIGYYIGYNQTGTRIGGYLVAICGFACSVMTSCGVFTFICHVYEFFEEISVLELLKKWIRIIISGLLVSIALSLILVNVRVSHAAGFHVTSVLVFSGIVYVVNWIAVKRGFKHHMVLVALSGISMLMFLNHL